jgi:hypothetical protein
MTFFLKAEVSYEPQYLEMNVPLGESSTFNGSIRNIGFQDVNVRCFAEGINHINIRFTPPSARINQGDIVPINICIDPIGAPPGEYKGLFYIRKDNPQDVLEKIPITIQVKNSSENADNSSRDQKPLQLCMKR